MRNAVCQLTAAGFIAIEKRARGRAHGVSIITVTNYERYQDPSNYEGRWSGQSREHQRAPIEEGEERNTVPKSAHVSRETSEKV